MKKHKTNPTKHGDNGVKGVSSLAAGESPLGEGFQREAAPSLCATVLPDCPYCGSRFETPNELFDHVIMYHSC